MTHRIGYTDQDEHDLTWVFTFGKYKNHSLRFVLWNDPEYVQWCVDTLDDFELDEEALELLQNEELRFAHFGD